ncbi:MAG: ribosome recycling factor [Chloroflexi bacterium]|nr:ribosome recycling factor [Chloroflexota bacterium]
MSEEVTRRLSSMETKMNTAVEGLKKELATIRTGRASPALIEHIKVDYAGVPTPLNHIAGISAPSAKLLVIQPWDQGSVHLIEKAILKSELGLTPHIDGSIIRLNIPPLTEERRQELTKIVHRRLEERRVALRNIRHETINELKELEKSKQISQDEHKRASTQVQKITDSFMAQVEQIGRDKESELLEV